MRWRGLFAAVRVTFLSRLHILKSVVQLPVDALEQGDLFSLAADNLVERVQSVLQVGKANLEINQPITV